MRGELPETMWAQVIRPSRYGEPRDAFRMEQVKLPKTLGPRDVWVEVEAAGINYNAVWASRGYPIDPVAHHPEDFHIAGSDASGVVAAVGAEVTEWSPGDVVVIDANLIDLDCPWVKRGRVAQSPSSRVLGLDANWGSFAQYTRVRPEMVHPMPRGLGWAEAATLVASGSSAWEMLHSWSPNQVQPGDVVLVFGGAGGVGSMAIQLARQAGARPVAVVSSPERAAYCRRIGAVAAINRRDFAHWGQLPQLEDRAAMAAWHQGARGFGAAIWEALGERVSPQIVIEHPGESTLPTSLYVCAKGGMVVLCGGSTGYNGSFDLRHLWTREKRIQGCHMFSHKATRAVLEAAEQGQLWDWCTEVVSLEQVGEAHHRMAHGGGWMGKAAVRIGSRDEPK